jgi:uncharacterized membrane protein YgcG
MGVYFFFDIIFKFGLSQIMNKILKYILILFAMIMIFPVIVMANNTENMRISISENNQKTVIQYDIAYVFSSNNKNRHGIFLSLPKIQDGIAYDYTLGDKPTRNSSNEKYDIINEINSFRIRIGDKDINLEPGQYNYRFTILTNQNKEYNHKFQYLYDWNDNINSIEVRRNGFSICESNTCSNNQISEDLNSSKPRANVGFAYLTIFQNYIWALLGSIIAWFAVIKKRLTDPLQAKVLKELPYYTPPQDLTPWQAQSLINKGDITPHETLAAYIFYLNNKQYITITPDTDNKTIILIKLKDLPTDLGPSELNTLVEYIISDGMEQGILNSEISLAELDNKIDEFTLQSNEHLYIRKPVLYPLMIVLMLTVVGGIIMFLLSDPFQKWLLIGNSYGIFIFFVFFLGMLLVYMGLRNFQRFNQDGYDRLQESIGYKYYLSYIEKEKLDFDNNPEEGARFYLTALPYAAQFNILEKFNKFFKVKQFITDIQADNSTLIFGTINSTPFYSVSADSGGGFDGGGGGGFDGGGGSW